MGLNIGDKQNQLRDADLVQQTDLPQVGTGTATKLTDVVTKWRSQLSGSQLEELRTAESDLYDDDGLPR